MIIWLRLQQNTGQENNPFFDKTHSERSRQKISANHADFSGEKNPLFGKKHTEEAKQKMSNSQKGKHYGSNSPMFGKIFSEETRKKMRENHADFSGEKAPGAKPTWEKVNIIRIKYLSGISSVKLAKEFGVNKSTILSIVKNKTWKL